MSNYLLKFGKGYFQKILKKKVKEAIANNETEGKEGNAPRKVIILD